MTASPRRNRVTPLGDVIATPGRGAWTGNRGRLHVGEEIVRFHSGNLWITCALQFRDWWHEQWQPHSFTWLYFQDEAVSLAAGHRPCALCRRVSYQAYQQAWGDALGVDRPSAVDMNRQLHAERIEAGTHRRRWHDVRWSDLPDGAFVRLDDGVPAIVVGADLVRWSAAGYGQRQRRPRSGTAVVITPPSSVAVLRAGYPVQIDDSARRAPGAD